ncbi:MAG: transposase [Betaproteobacteria bacterium]|nr:transposase [Betaproteobacteria bacterium]
MKLTERAASVLYDPRDPDLITHPLHDLLHQRIYAIVQGYEDLNDHAQARSRVHHWQRRKQSRSV